MIKLKIKMETTYYSLKLIGWCMKLKSKMFMKILERIKKCLIAVIVQLRQNIIMNEDSNKLVAIKMKDETSGVSIEDFVGLRSEMYSFLADDRSAHKEASGVNKNVVARISHREYKDVMLNSKCLRHLRDKTQVKYFLNIMD